MTRASTRDNTRSEVTYSVGVGIALRALAMKSRIGVWFSMTYSRILPL
jgi:hypothetical protein